MGSTIWITLAAKISLAALERLIYVDFPASLLRAARMIYTKHPQ